MNLLHLKYAVEVDNTRSITKAAANLFMSQPNLSRAIKELEETLGITVFNRTSQGIVPTQQGEEFLAYAKNILRQIDEIESMYKTEKQEKVVMKISVPRADYVSCAFTEFVNSLDSALKIEINYRETNSRSAINNILQNNYNLGIIRYQSAYEDHFINMLREKDLKSELIWEFEYRALMRAGHPLADRKNIDPDELMDYIEIAHGDSFVPTLPILEVQKNELSDSVDKRIFVYERGSQYDLLSTVPNTYMWTSPIPETMLRRLGLVQVRCSANDRKYRDVLICRNNYRLTTVDMQFIDKLRKTRDACGK